jgi:paraquat-inducible protein A
VAVIIALEVIALPFLRFGLLLAVLGPICMGWRARWMGPVFRWSERLDQWSMPDVFLFGGIVGYSRIEPFLPIHVEAGGWCLVGVAVFTLLTRATLERRALWHRIGPIAPAWHPGMIGCPACDFPVSANDEGKSCPRCRARVWRVKPYSAMRALALTVAAFAAYPAAYLYPMEYSDQLNTLHGYSIMTGVVLLAQAHLWFFAVVIFVASVLIPLLKIFALIWFWLSLYRRSSAHLRLKTRLNRVVNLIGRWSHIDVFTVAVLLPLMNLPGFLSVIVGQALPAFLAVVVLTMFATEAFDPRSLWIAGSAEP